MSDKSENREKAPRKRSALQGLFSAHRRFWIAFLVFVLSFYMVAVTAPGPGVAWDEAIYIGQAVWYLNWYNSPETSLRAESIREHWQVPMRTPNGVTIRPWEVHPPLGKAMIACAMGTLADMGSGKGGVDPLIAARLVPAFCAAGVCLLLFLIVSRTFGAVAGTLAPACLLLMPRIFGHAHFATLEMPLLLTWVLTVYTFEKGTRNAVWSVACGIAFGLALLTRFNAVFLPAFLIPWGFLAVRWRTLQNAWTMAIISPLVFLAGWPAMWVNTPQVLNFYLSDKLKRGEAPIPFAYFGQLHPSPEYPIVMTALTVPIPLLALAIFGALQAFRRDNGDEKDKDAEDDSHARRKTAWLLLFAFFGPIMLMMSPGVPHYDGVRLFLGIFPFLAGLAGIGAATLWENYGPEHARRVIVLGLLALAVIVVPLVLLYPLHLSYYNGLIGGPWGANHLGMEIVYWNESFNDDVLDAVAEALPDGGKVALEGIGSKVDDLLRATGRWPAGVDVVDFETHKWDLLVIVPRKAWIEEKRAPVFEFMGDKSHKPVRVWHLSPIGKVPVCLLYRKPS